MLYLKVNICSVQSCATPLQDDMFVSSHLKMKNYLIFSRFNRIFALSLHKIRFGSA